MLVSMRSPVSQNLNAAAESRTIPRPQRKLRTSALRRPRCAAAAQRASKLMGISVKNLQNDKMGQVDNLVIDMPRPSPAWEPGFSKRSATAPGSAGFSAGHSTPPIQ